VFKWLQPVGQVTKQPTKVTFKGVEPGSDRARELLDEHRNTINHFHRAQHQNHELGVVPSRKTRAHYPGLTLTYTNCEGQERIDVEVTGTTAVQVGQEKPTGTLPNWAVVDLIVQNSAEIECKFEATLITPRVERLSFNPGHSDPSRAIMYKGIEYDAGNDQDYSDGTWTLGRGLDGWGIEPIISYADPYLTDGEIEGITNRVSSLLVDFREMGETAMVVVDIYGWMVEGGPEYVLDPQTFLGYYFFNTVTTVSPEPVDYYSISAPVIDDLPTFYVFTIGGTEYPTLDALKAARPDYTINSPSGGYPKVDFFSIPQAEPGYDSTVVGQFALDDGGTSETIDPSYAARGYDFQTHYVGSYDTYTSTQEKEPRYSIPTYTLRPGNNTRTCDLAFAFYDQLNKPLNDYIADHEAIASAMWVVSEGVQPSRAQFSEVTLSQFPVDEDGDPLPLVPELPDNPKGFKPLGRLTFDRKSRSVGFEPV
jgi:hypothetical protein